MPDYPLELLKSMLEAYSPSGQEHEMAKLFQAEMESNGFRVSRDNVGNIVGTIGRGGPHILLCGHMDTVPGEIPVRLEEDVIYGRGAVDAKSALAAMLAGTILAKRQTELPFRVTVAGVVEEETTSAGIRELANAGVAYDMAVFGEPSGASNLIIGYKGSLQVQATCTTDGGHSASPWLSKNSAEEAFEFWKTLKESMLQNGSSSKFNVLTGCLTHIDSVGVSNNIPSEAMIGFDIRVPPGTPPSQAFEKINALASGYEQSHKGVSLRIKLLDSTQSILVDTSSRVVGIFRWAIRSKIGGQVLLTKKTGTSDMNLFSQSHTIPMIAYGPGDSRLDHTMNERVSMKEYLDSVTVYAAAIEKAAILDQKPNLLTAS